MQRALYDVAVAMPFLWWLVVMSGIWTFWRTRSSAVPLLVVGSALLAAIGSLNAIFAPSLVLGIRGEVLSESQWLLPVGVQILLSGIGVVLVVAGVLMLFSRLRGPSANT